MTETKKFCAAKLVCDGVELTKGVNWAKAETASAQCNDCRRFRAKINDGIKARATRRIWPSDSNAVWPNAHLWRQLDKNKSKIEIAKQIDIDIEAGILCRDEDGQLRLSENASKHREPENKGGGIRSLPGPHVAPTGPVEMPKPEEWEETRTVTRNNDIRLMSAFHDNLEFAHKVCEFTGEHPSLCHGAHIFPKSFCKDKFLGYKWELDNGIFVISSINDAMERAGHYLHPDGYLLWREKFGPLKTFMELGIYDKQIEMTPRRKFFANLFMMQVGI